MPLSIDAIEPEARRLSDRYEFLRELGRGGSAVVYLARELATGQIVAVKLLKELGGLDTDAQRRFVREAETVATLEHPNIVRVLRVEERDGRPIAIVSVYIPGETLRVLLRRDGALPFDRAAQLLREIASALAYAHERRLVHRDVKPENVILEAHTGRALLADFGVARRLDADSLLTTVGSAVGTPSYMAPEQVTGEPVDARADVYALGLVGWEMLAGRRPWEGETLYGVLHKQQHERLPALDALRPDIPTFLLRAIERAIEKDPSCRWADAGELLACLSPVATSLPPVRRAAPLGDAPVEEVTAAFARPPVSEISSGSSSAMPSEGSREISSDVPAEPVIADEPAAPAPLPAFVTKPLRVREPRAPRAPREPRTPRARRAIPWWPVAAAALVMLIVVAGALVRGASRHARAPISGDRALDSALAAVTDSSHVVLVDSGARATPRATTRETSAGTVVPTPPPSAAPSRAARTTARATPSRQVAVSAVPARGRHPTVPVVAPAPSTLGDARCDSPAADDQRACLLSAIDRNDAALNAVYRTLIARMRERGGERAVAALRVEQRAWISSRDRACRGGPAAPGSRWGASRVSCFARASAEREAALRARLGG